ncbi:glycoside hydrolase family 97 protein [Sphingomonas sp. CROZ-RG-20F-R02-07]|uniref:glycoside hydrolase family 97 protein n=1 Tax=Sphingomonas sp. CROZ-RG-20F-R02-07 TaxID=2914832 RepID=UPI001F55FFC1|nr:glycoside hydrolase family 97 protein [Sphingomonas sp. CROZ-RG-20F-R02-07]
MSIRSPNGRVTVVAGLLPGGQLAVRVRHEGSDVIAPSPVGLRLADDPLGPVRIVTTRVEAPAVAPDRRTPRYGGLAVHVRERGGARRSFDLRLRAYDGGAAFRLVLPRRPGASYRIAAETTELRFPRDYDCLAVAHSEYLNSHEGDYAPVRASALRAGALYDLPLSCRTGRSGEAIALAESDVEHYPGAYLVKAGSLGAAIRLTPLPANDALAAVIDGPVVTPWRVVMIANRPEQLIANTLVDDLATPSRIGDARWVRPGKAAWGWWAGLKASGVPDAGYNNATYRAYVDFAGRFGLLYFVIDWGWAARPDGDKHLADITQFRSGVDIPALARYAAQRHVRLWLWTNWDALGRRMDEVFALYERWGIAGVKVDYVYRQDQIAIGYYHRLLATAARHHLMVNIHGAPVPRGLERTYPNFITEEGVMGAEYNKWSRKVTAGYNVRSAYSRAVIGPMDYTPGGFRNVAPGAFVARHALPEVMTTRAQQLAMFVVYPSPLQSLCDSPGAYLNAAGRPMKGAAFLRIVPATWDETRGIAGDWGRWIAVARRSGGRWFVGVMGDEAPRTVALPLGFLGNGRWRVRALVDGSQPTDVAGHKGVVDGGGTLWVPLAARGGAVLVLDRAH